jgi:hypothetical protein
MPQPDQPVGMSTKEKISCEHGSQGKRSAVRTPAKEKRLAVKMPAREKSSTKRVPTRQPPKVRVSVGPNCQFH